ncbi:MFS transporter [Acetobacter fallax]|uniref:MFS transporter n=1 Tax=Acetobacter fallax TaxID=1737473 RepID=A0ABX0KDU6_9PROT|nr:MFS transporter [Acetobacter fallax]NHO32640.1 MFS transporter [Acetobacter fallax]NHO36162.1 MFS transporter [Acetobacter fallax]
MEVRTPDEIPPSAFHLRLALIAGGGPFCDGYILGLIGIVLPLLVHDFHLSADATGLIGASSLLGVFVGGLSGGMISDRFGRKLLYTVNIVMFAAFSAAQFFSDSFTSLLMWRFLIGVAIGADYPIATAYVTEFMPRRWRGPALAGLITFWWLGYVASFLIGYVLISWYPGNWNLVLGSSFVPSSLLLLCRAGMPESPLWLAGAGRVTEARHIVKTFLHTDVSFEGVSTNRMRGGAGRALSMLLSPRYRGTLLFVCTFWILQSAPAFSIHTLQAQILAQMHMRNPLLAACVVTCFTFLGILPVSFGLINVMGRRTLLIWSFILGAAALLFIAAWPGQVGWLVIAAFIIYSAVEAAGSGLQFVYPNELFPTEIRGTAVGFASSASRLGAALGTFLLPLGVSHYGVRTTLFAACTILAAGAFISWRWAPETSGLSLSEASHITPS